MAPLIPDKVPAGAPTFKSGPAVHRSKPTSMADAGRHAMSRMGAAGMQDRGQPTDDAGKIPMPEAGYHQAANPQQCCGTCVHETSPGVCELVAGRVDDNGVSDLWEPMAPAGAPLPGAGQPPVAAPGPSQVAPPQF